jgi:hypothetical protein
MLEPLLSLFDWCSIVHPAVDPTGLIDSSQTNEHYTSPSEPDLHKETPLSHRYLHSMFEPVPVSFPISLASTLLSSRDNHLLSPYYADKNTLSEGSPDTDDMSIFMNMMKDTGDR